jgi:hypothetical protein
VAELKTKRTTASVDDFLNAIENDQVRQDSWTLVDIMQKTTKAKPELWGSGLVGFGRYHYKYASGREGDWMLVAFAPRKDRITLYLMTGFEHYKELMAQLGKHSHGKGCLHIKRLSDIHLPTLKKLVKESVEHLKKKS